MPQKTWPHEAGDASETWPHDAGDWQVHLRGPLAGSSRGDVRRGGFLRRDVDF